VNDAPQRPPFSTGSEGEKIFVKEPGCSPVLVTVRVWLSPAFYAFRDALMYSIHQIRLTPRLERARRDRVLTCRPDEQRKAIEEVLADRQEAIAAALIEEAETLVPVAVQSTLGELRRRGRRQVHPGRSVAGITKEQVAAYRAQVAKGGTDIIGARGHGPRRRPRLHHHPAHVQALAQRHGHSGPGGDSSASISDGQRDGMHPHQIARELRGYFDGTEHNAVTAARTEAQKLRTDARVATYLKTGVHYLEYIAVGDDVTRPEHLARDGKIYPIDKAPWLGEAELPVYPHRR